jgi:hypothetical protein
VLAINEGPLYVLRRLAEQRGFRGVNEALRQVTAGRYFIEAQRPEPPQENIIVIDLSLRNLLVPSVVDAVLDRLTEGRFYTGLNQADPAVHNRDALRHAQVRTRLGDVLKLANRRVGHITMRQLIGFLAFLITGGQAAADRMRAGQDTLSFSYANLAFEGGAGPLFEAVRAVFDPATVTHPEWDERLWMGETRAGDWLWQKPPAPLTFPESERDKAFRVIKRLFFFGHASGNELVAMLPTDEKDFQRILHPGEAPRAGLVRDLVLALNRFFEPDCPSDERDRLHLWQTHRYDVRPPSAFVALGSMPDDRFQIEQLKFAPWVEAWLPEEQRDRRSFALVAQTPGGRDVPLLEVDRELYLTLVDAQRGLGRSSWSRSASRRITRFIDQILRAVDFTRDVEDVRIRNVENNLDERFEIVRKPPRYRL